MKWVEEVLPTHDSPMLFGMHDNGDVICNMHRSDLLFDDLCLMVNIGADGLDVERVDGGGAKLGAARGDENIKQKLKRTKRKNAASSGAQSRDPDSVVTLSTSDILERIPEALRLERASSIHKNEEKITKATSVVLFQEIKKFNRLMDFVRGALEDLVRAILGEIVMDGQLEKMYQSIYNNKVPDSWMNVGYPSLKSLDAWVDDLRIKVEFMRSWLEVSWQQMQKGNKEKEKEKKERKKI